jgi:hypothetical protein
MNNNIPGFFIIKNKVLAVACSGLTITGLVTTLLYILNDKIKNEPFIDNKSRNNNILLNFNALLLASLLSLILISFFYYLDCRLDNTHLNFFGKKIIVKEESEKPYSNMFIIRKMNAHSSVFHFFAGLYILLDLSVYTKAYYASILYGILLVLQGLASYLWWSSSREYAWKLDHLMMDSHINALIGVFLSIIFPFMEIFLVLGGLLWIKYKYLTQNGSNLINRCCSLLIMTIVLTIKFNSCGNINLFILACLLTLGGLVPKIADTAYNFYYGTALFHFMESFGFLTFYYWAQTII